MDFCPSVAKNKYGEYFIYWVIEAILATGKLSTCVRDLTTIFISSPFFHLFYKLVLQVWAWNRYSPKNQNTFRLLFHTYKKTYQVVLHDAWSGYDSPRWIVEYKIKMVAIISTSKTRLKLCKCLVSNWFLFRSISKAGNYITFRIQKLKGWFIQYICKYFWL